MEVIVSSSQRTTTRRTALQSALSGLLAAGAASMLPTTTSAAPEPVSMQHDTITTLAQTDADFAAWLERWTAKRAATVAEYEALSDQLDTLVDKQTASIIGDMVDTRLNWDMLEGQLFFEITARHFPGLAPALRMAWMHAIEQYSDEAGVCCAYASEPW
jgi:hypothetical protein